MTSTEFVQQSDRELISAALAGDGAAFGRLMEKHRPPLLETARRILNHREEAEDVLQDVFLQAYKHLGRFRGEAKFSTWLYSITLNRIRNHIRQKKTRRVISIDESPQEEKNPLQLPEKGPTLDEVLVRQSDAERLHDAVSGLKEDFRAIFVLHYFQYLPLEEISRRLGKPLGTVKVYLHRARKAVQADLIQRGESGGRPGPAAPRDRGLTGPGL